MYFGGLLFKSIPAGCPSSLRPLWLYVYRIHPGHALRCQSRPFGEDAQQKHRYPSNPTQSPRRGRFREIPFVRPGVRHKERCLLSRYPSICRLLIYSSQLVWSSVTSGRFFCGLGIALLVPDECSTVGMERKVGDTLLLLRVGVYVSQMR